MKVKGTPRRVADAANDRRRGAVDRLLLLIGGYRARPRAGARHRPEFRPAARICAERHDRARRKSVPDGEVRFTRPPADQRFLEPYSGAYFQISGKGQEVFPSRSLWDRRLKVDHAA